MAKVTFNGATTRIIKDSGITTLDVQIDIYSDWKEWALSGNLGFSQALRTFGGDETIVGQRAPQYFFLTNGWRIQVDQDFVDVGLNLYTDEGVSPYIIGAGAGVSDKNSDAVIVSTGVDEALDYGGVIQINTGSGFSGQEWPFGTTSSPVNNLADAVTIAAIYNINSFEIDGVLLLDRDMINSHFYSNSIFNSIDTNGYNVNNSSFTNLNILGDFAGSKVVLLKCQTNNLDNIHGLIDSCYLMGIISPTANESIIITDCKDGIAGNVSPIIDYTYGNISLSLRAYDGDIRAINSTSAGNLSTYGCMASRIEIDVSNTSGFFHLRGIGIQVGVGNGATIDAEGLNRQSIKRSEFLALK